MPIQEDNRNSGKYGDFYAQYPDLDPKYKGPRATPVNAAGYPTGAAQAANTTDTRQYGQVRGGAVLEADRASALGAERGERMFSLGEKLGQESTHYERGAAAQQGQYQTAGLGLMRDAGAANTMQTGTRDAQMAALGRLRGFYEQGPGPSAAEAQLRAGQDANARQAMSIARTGGGSPSAVRAALRQNAAGGAQTNQAAATLRAQENDAFQQRRLGAMSAEQGALAGVRGADLGAMGTHYGAAGQAAQTGLGYGQLGAAYGGLRTTGMLGAAGIGANTMQAGEAQRGQILGQQLGADTSRYGADRGVQVGMAQIAQQQDAADKAMIGSLIGTGVMMASDVRAKENIRPVSLGDSLGALDESHARAGADVGPRIDMRPAQGYAYDYRDPARHGEGTHVGPMAQDLERTPAAGAVSTAPDGTKQVDPGRLTMVNTAALSEQQKRLDRLEEMVSTKGNTPGQHVIKNIEDIEGRRLPKSEQRFLATMGHSGPLKEADDAFINGRHSRMARRAR